MTLEGAVLFLMFGWVIGMSQAIWVAKATLKRLEQFFEVMENE